MDSKTVQTKFRRAKNVYKMYLWGTSSEKETAEYRWKCIVSTLMKADVGFTCNDVTNYNSSPLYTQHCKAYEDKKNSNSYSSYDRANEFDDFMNGGYGDSAFNMFHEWAQRRRQREEQERREREEKARREREARKKVRMASAAQMNFVNLICNAFDLRAPHRQLTFVEASEFLDYWAIAFEKFTARKTQWEQKCKW
jgi:hypothetical protein